MHLDFTMTLSTAADPKILQEGARKFVSVSEIHFNIEYSTV